jgi:hypothetical protein
MRLDTRERGRAREPDRSTGRKRSECMPEVEHHRVARDDLRALRRGRHPGQHGLFEDQGGTAIFAHAVHHPHERSDGERERRAGQRERDRAGDTEQARRHEEATATDSVRHERREDRGDRRPGETGRDDDAELRAAGVELAEETSERHSRRARGHRAHERGCIEKPSVPRDDHETFITRRYGCFRVLPSPV